MIGEVLGKALVVVKGDTSHARAEIAKLSAEEQKAAKARIKAQEESNAALERGQQKFMLVAAGMAAGWAIVSSSVKKYEEHLESMGVTGERELQRLNAVTGDLTKAQNQLQIAIAKVAIEAAPAALELAKMATELANIVGGAAALIRAAKDIPGAGYAWSGVKGAARYGMPIYGQALAAKDIYGHFAGGGTVEPGRAFSRWSNMGEFGLMNAEDEWRSWVRNTLGGEEAPVPTGGTDRPSRRRSGGGRGGDEWGFLDDVRLRGSQFISYAQRYQEEQATGRTWSPGGIDAATRGAASDASRDLAKFMEELEAAEGEQAQTAMEKIVGPIKQFDEYAIGFGLVSDAATSAFEAIVTGSESAGAALKRVVAQGIMALGKDMLIRSLQEGAWAISDLAKGNIPGAAMHGKAAAAFFAGSLAAGVAAAGLGGSLSGGGAGAGGSYASAGGIGGVAQSGGGAGGGYNLTIVQGDGFAESSPRYVARRTRRAMDLASRYAPYNGGQPG